MPQLDCTETFHLCVKRKEKLIQKVRYILFVVAPVVNFLLLHIPPDQLVLYPLHQPASHPSSESVNHEADGKLLSLNE